MKTSKQPLSRKLKIGGGLRITKTIEIRKSIEADILPIAVNMRDEDAKEVWDSNLYTPYKALKRCMESIGNKWTIIVNGVPIGMVGVSRETFLSAKGIPWLLGTDALTCDKKLFMRISIIVLNNISEGFGYLENYVSVENKMTLKWLKCLGFKFSKEVKSITGVVFKQFYKEV